MSVSPMNWEGFFAKNLRTERSRLGITQQDLASYLGMKSGATVTQWEKSTSFPNLETFVRLCDYFEKHPTQMLYEDLTDTSPPKLKSVPGASETSKEGGRGQPTGSQLPEEDKPPKEDKEDLKEVRRQLLQLMNKVEELEHN